jgi:lysophospholipase L1-like esterase
VDFRTIVDIEKPGFQIKPCEEILFVGSCFADEISRHFRDNGFPVTANPYGVMYNPVSILHTIARYENAPRIVFLTLGTNHVYRLKETGEIVDNCEKRPQHLFQEEQLTADECAENLQETIGILCQRNPDVQVVLTVSPIRYRKYGYHGSQLSKATLLLAVDKVLEDCQTDHVCYFPAYEIVLDELRDYRFYAPDMLHPSEQTVDYIWERLVETYFSLEAKSFLEEWRPIRQALHHRPFNPEAPAYKEFKDKTMLKLSELRKKYCNFAL